MMSPSWTKLHNVQYIAQYWPASDYANDVLSTYPMPTTRRQAAQQNASVPKDTPPPKATPRTWKTSTKKKAHAGVKEEPVAVGANHEKEENEHDAAAQDEDEHPAKKPKVEAQVGDSPHANAEGNQDEQEASDSKQQTEGGKTVLRSMRTRRVGPLGLLPCCVL